ASSTWSFPAVALTTATWAVGDGAVVGPGAASLPPRCVITNPVRTAIAATPTTDARKTDLVFIASIMHQVVSAVTMLPKEPGKARLNGSVRTNPARARLRDQQHPPEGTPPFDVRVRFGSLRKRELAVDDDL